MHFFAAVRALLFSNDEHDGHSRVKRLSWLPFTTLRATTRGYDDIDERRRAVTTRGYDGVRRALTQRDDESL